MYQVGDAVDTTEGSAIVQKVYDDGELALSFPEYTTPDELFTMAPVDVSPCTRPRRSSRRTAKPVVDVLRPTKQQRSSSTRPKTVGDVHRPTKRQHSSHQKEERAPRHMKRQRSSSTRPKTVGDVHRPTKRQHSSSEERVPRPMKRQRSSPKKDRTVSTYKKHLTSTVSKTEQNTAFLGYLRSLGIPMKNLVVLVLDTSRLRTTRMLLAAGLLPSRIYIPQPNGVEAAQMLKQYPTLRVFAGLKAGDLIWKMADRKVRFHGALLDYCGAGGKIGRKNMPVDDMANLLRYNLLADQAVLTQTVCARSSVRVTEKFQNFKYLVKTVRGCSRRDRRRVTKAKELIYTDPGSQTMCHFRCVISK